MKTKWWLLLAAALALMPRGAEASGACTAARFHDWQDMGCNPTYAGAGGLLTGKSGAGGNQSQCDGDCGMPRWWVSEPYINLFMSDTPLSYTMSSGKEMAFKFFYHQRTKLPDSDEVTNYWQHPRASDNYPNSANASTCGTNAFWGHNWNMSIQFWDAAWENDWAIYYGTNIVVSPPNYAPFNHGNYEALVYRPEGGIEYYYNTNGASSLKNTKSQTQLAPIYSGGYPLTTNAPTPDSSGIYWGDTNVGFKLVYPDGSQDIFSLNVYANTASQNSTARAFLTQRIDPQGRITQLGYEKFYANYPLTAYRLKYVVDPDARTNQFKYTASNSFQLSEIDDPYGRNTTFGYYSDGTMSQITDASGFSSAFQYQPGPLVTNNVICGLNSDGSVYYCLRAVTLPSSGWITQMTNLYGATSFSYYQVLESDVTDGYQQRAIYASEPTGAQQLYYYLHDAYDTNAQPLMATTATAPTVPGQTNFDNGNSGAHAMLNYRNSIYWGRRQCAALSSNVLSSLPSNMSNALTRLTANDFKKGRIRNWLFQSDGISISESLSSEREPSQDAAGQTEDTYRTWYNYAGPHPPEIIGSNPQPICIASLLPDGTTQYTTYNYYPQTYFFGGAGLVSDNESTYSKPDNSIGVLTNWYHYAGNSVDLLSVSNSSGQYVNYGYNSYHQITAVTNALQQVTTLSWDVGNTWNLTGVQLPAGKSIGLSYYTPSSTPTSTSSMLQQITISPEGRSFTINNYSAGQPSNVTDDRGVTVANSWDGLNRLTGTAFPDNTTISNIYYRLDLVASKDRLTNWTYYAFDGLQHLTAFTNANNAVTSYSYCGCGSLQTIVDPYTNQTQFSYDNQGNRTSINFPDNSSLYYQYDFVGRLNYVFDGLYRGIQINRNNQGLVTSVLSPNGLLRKVIYDAVNRPINVTDANGITVTNQYDLVGELLKKTWPDNISEGYGYSAAGLIAYTNRDQKVTFYGRDGSGRLTAVTNANLEVSRFSYDSLDNVTNLVDGRTDVTSWQYNQYGWLTNKMDGINRNAFRYSYNANGWVTNRWTPEKGNAGYTFDNVGNLKSIVYPSQTNSYAYDALNRLTNMVDAVGTTAFAYTQVGRLQSENGPWTNDSVAYTYAEGLRTAMSISSQLSTLNFSYGYDSGWRMTNITSPAGVFGYSFGFQPASSLVTGIQLPNDAQIVNTFDALARQTGTSLNNYWGHTLDGYSYTPDALGLRTNIVRNLGLSSSMVTAGFDNIGQLTSWSASETNGMLRQNEQLNFGFDAANNLHSRNNGALSQIFNTDAANELTNVTRTGTFTVSGATPAPMTSVTVNGSLAQAYGDFTFARTNLTLTNGANTFTIIAQNNYVVRATNILNLNLPTSVILSSDNNGNVTNDGTRSFAYDSENQLTNVMVAGHWQSSFAYDGLNRRRIARDFVWQTNVWALTNEIHYVYDGWLLIQERGTNNNPLVTYTRGLDLSGSLQSAGGIGGLLARTDTNGSTFYHADAVGNVTALIDGKENIVARYLYGPFGKLTGQWGALATVNTIQFSSLPQYRGLTMYPRRAYELNFQRWLNRDPLGEAGGINLYAYVANSPINYIDPLGLDLQLSISAGGVIGGNPYSDYPIGEQSFWTLSLSLGVSVSSDGFQIFLQSQNSSLTGFGTFGGGGISGGISHSDCHIKSGTSIDTNQHVEANVGVWATTGYSGDYSDSSGGVSFPIPKLDIGAGGGAMVANGPATTYTISSPVIGFAPPTGTAYTPVTNVNSPPNSWSP